MKRLIINLDPQEQDVIGALTRAVRCVTHYTQVLHNDGQRITAMFDSGKTIWISHDKNKDTVGYSEKVTENVKMGWINL
jgi:hypothetical protein